VLSLMSALRAGASRSVGGNAVSSALVGCPRLRGQSAQQPPHALKGLVMELVERFSCGHCRGRHASVAQVRLCSVRSLRVAPVESVADADKPCCSVCAKAEASQMAEYSDCQCGCTVVCRAGVQGSCCEGEYTECPACLGEAPLDDCCCLWI